MNTFRSKVIFLYEIIYNTTRAFIQDDPFTHSAAVSYFIMLSIIPLIVLAVSILSYFAGNTEEAYQWILTQVNNFSPDIAYKYDIYLKSLTNEIINIRGTAMGFGILSLIWIGMNTACSLENSLNVVMQISTVRNYIQRRAISLLFIVLLFFLLYGTTIISAVMITTINKQNPLLNMIGIDVSLLWTWITKFLSFIVYYLAFYLIYRVLPRVKMPTKAVHIASFLGALTWAFAKWMFSWFVIHLSQYSKIYGSIAGIMIFIIWLYFSVLIIVFFGEMVSIIKSYTKL